MVGVAVVVMQVSFQGLSRFGLRIASICTAFLLVTIAIVPAGSVLRPNAHTHPAELVAAFSAGHVVASAILLDGGLAFGALFGMCRYPVGSFRVVLTFLDPLVDQRAWSRLVIVEGAAEAEGMSTVAIDCGDDLMEFPLLDGAIDRIYAIGGGTPFEIVFVVHVSSSEKFFVPAVAALAQDSSTRTPAKKNAYLLLSSEETSMPSDLESTMRLHPSPGHLILAASPSSLIF
jgi:hypothetical protein